LRSIRDSRLPSCWFRRLRFPTFVGAGHVEDAQRLTEKYGGNPQVWEDVSYWLLQKSTQQYSTDAVVKFGFCRVLEPVNYVANILERFNHYKQFVVT
jgi:membrane-bound lytic murein transglycosylase F